MSLLRAWLTSCLLLLAACDGAGQNELTFTGSSTVAPVMAELAAAYENRHDDWRIDVQSGGSSRGIRDVRQGLADAGLISRRLTPDEQTLTTYTLAYDGIALIVHANNPIVSLDKKSVRRIYRGEVSNWSELGGANRPVVVVNKAAGRATLKVFQRHFELKNQAIKADLVAGENQQVIQTVARNRAAIGYVSIGTAEYGQQDGSAIKLLPLHDVAATTANLQQGEYPLSRPLNIVTQGQPGEALSTFMEFWQTPAAADIIRQHYFVPATP